VAAARTIDRRLVIGQIAARPGHHESAASNESTTHRLTIVLAGLGCHPPIVADAGPFAPHSPAVSRTPGRQETPTERTLSENHPKWGGRMAVTRRPRDGALVGPTDGETRASN
jgi:hypothetical protein